MSTSEQGFALLYLISLSVCNVPHMLSKPMITITYFPHLYCPQAVLVAQMRVSCQGHAELRDCRASPDLHATYTRFITA